MKVGDLIRPKRNPRVVAVVVRVAGLEPFNRVQVLIVGSATPEMCDRGLWEVVNESR
jgi:hypothetical protein